MKFEEILHLLVGEYGDTTAHEAGRILALAFPGAVRERATYVCGVRLSHATPFSPTSSALFPVLPPALDPSSPSTRPDHESVIAELKQQVTELQDELKSLQQTSVQIADLENQADHLISHTCISEGPDTLEHLDSFSITTILNNVRREAPDLLRLFQTLGNSSRNLGDDGLAVEQLNGLVSLCTLLNTRFVHVHEYNTFTYTYITYMYLYIYTDLIELRGCSYSLLSCSLLVQPASR